MKEKLTIFLEDNDFYCAMSDSQKKDLIERILEYITDESDDEKIEAEIDDAVISMILGELSYHIVNGVTEKQATDAYESVRDHCNWGESFTQACEEVSYGLSDDDDDLYEDMIRSFKNETARHINAINTRYVRMGGSL